MPDGPRTLDRSDLKRQRRRKGFNVAGNRPSKVGRIREATTKSLAAHPGVIRQAPQHSSLLATDLTARTRSQHEGDNQQVNDNSTGAYPFAMSVPLSACCSTKVHSDDALGLEGKGTGGGDGASLHFDSL